MTIFKFTGSHVISRIVLIQNCVSKALDKVLIDNFGPARTSAWSVCPLGINESLHSKVIPFVFQSSGICQSDQSCNIIYRLLEAFIGILMHTVQLRSKFKFTLPVLRFHFLTKSS